MRRGAFGALRATLLLVVSALGCRDQPAPEAAGNDVARPPVAIPLVDSTALLTPSTYDPALGPLLLLPLPGDATGTVASLLSPLLPLEAPIGDTAGLVQRVGAGVVTLFGREGALGDRVFSQIEVASAASCPAWPTGRLSPRLQDSAASAPRAWRVALPEGVAVSISLDSIEALPSRDSAMLAASLTRLASGLVEDSSSPFRGLPFRVTRVFVTRGVADAFALGELVRRVPQEDRPLEERLFVVVATPSSDAKGWRIVWHERTSGREEEVIATEPLAAVLVGTPRHAVVFLGRDDGSGTAVALLERANGRWRVRWESPVTGC